jgi:hypothetical protein
MSRVRNAGMAGLEARTILFLISTWENVLGSTAISLSLPNEDADVDFSMD